MEHYVKVSIIKDSNIVFIEDLFNFALQPKTTYFVFKKKLSSFNNSTQQSGTIITLHSMQQKIF